MAPESISHLSDRQLQIRICGPGKLPSAASADEKRELLLGHDTGGTRREQGHFRL